MNYHVTEDGPKICRASKVACPIGGAHFDTKENAQYAYEFAMEKNAAIEKAEPDTFSAKVARDYAHWSVINDHLHESTDRCNDAEFIYYNTPRGKLELKRRLKAGREAHKALAERIESAPADAGRFTLDEDFINKQVALGEAMVREKAVYPDLDFNGRSHTPTLHYLAEQSHNWLKNLSTEEQEAISHFTSDGSVIAKEAIGIRSDYRTDVSEHEAKRYLKTVKKAVAKAPKLEEPIQIWRGTSVEEIYDFIRIPEGEEDTEAVFNAIEAGEYNGEINPKSRIYAAPASLSVSPMIASRFIKPAYDKPYNDKSLILISLKAKTMAVPGAVGAWGVNECEIMSNPSAKYRVAGGKRLIKGEKDQKYFILELEEI